MCRRNTSFLTPTFLPIDCAALRVRAPLAQCTCLSARKRKKRQLTLLSHSHVIKGPPGNLRTPKIYILGTSGDPKFHLLGTSNLTCCYSGHTKFYILGTSNFTSWAPDNPKFNLQGTSGHPKIQILNTKISRARNPPPWHPLFCRFFWDLALAFLALFFVTSLALFSSPP